jgi:hypothetical protein
MGHAMITCPACHDQLRQTTFYEPAHDSGHDPLTGWVMAADPGPERIGDHGQRDRDRLRPADRGDADHADDFLGGVRAPRDRGRAGLPAESRRPGLRRHHARDDEGSPPGPPDRTRSKIVSGARMPASPPRPWTA